MAPDIIWKIQTMIGLLPLFEITLYISKKDEDSIIKIKFLSAFSRRGCESGYGIILSFASLENLVCSIIKFNRRSKDRMKSAFEKVMNDFSDVFSFGDEGEQILITS